MPSVIEPARRMVAERRARGLLLACSLACGLAAALGQETAGSAGSRQEVIRSRVDLIELDVTATDTRGEVVRGLTVEDFEVLEDGRPVEVLAFRAVDIPARSPSSATEPADLSGAARGHNADEGDGGAFVVVVGNVELPVFPRAKTAVLALVDRLGPNDKVAMLSVGGHTAYQVDFTAEKSRIARALDTPVRSGAQDHVILDVLHRVAGGLEPIRGRRKVIVFVGDVGAGLAGSAEMGGLNLIPALQAFEAAAARANIVLYAISPRYAFALDEMVAAGSAEDRGRQLSQVRDVEAGLQTLAARAGGWALVRSNLFDANIDRLLAESRSYYVIGYRTLVPNDGRYHRISVAVRRPDVVVRARSGYMAQELSARRPQAQTPLDRLIGAPIQSSGLAMRVIATPLPWRPGEGSAVLIVTEVRGSDLGSPGGLELKAVALDMRGRVRASDHLAGKLETGAGGKDGLVRLVTSLQLGPGRWQLRIAARRMDGRTEGSTFVEVEVPDPSGELVLGGLVLATAGRTGALGAERIPPQMMSVPLAARMLPARLALRGALPLRVGARHQAAKVRITRSLIGPDGTREDLGALERPGRDFVDGTVVEAPLPDNLQSGHYRLQVDVAVGRTVASRELSFRIH